MYSQFPVKLSPEQLERFRQLATCVDISPGPGGSRMSPPYETETVFTADLHPILPGPYLNLTVVALYPGAQIQAHTDAPFPGTRCHIPLVLNEGCWVYSNDGSPQESAGNFAYRMKTEFRYGKPGYDAADLLEAILAWQSKGPIWQQLEVGQVYVMDPTLPHGSVNWGPTTRLHLIVDRSR